MKIIDQDIIFLSYDEPNAEENYADLLTKVPWAKRVHGVEGSDAAHKAAAKASETDRFVLIDGDNIPDPDFFNLQLKLTEHNQDHVFRWKARNEINGLMYGNGGLSCWTKQFIEKMQTHEHSDGSDETCVEFCFDPKYQAMHDCYSTTYPNGSPYQAWRAGFREGVKMCLDRGAKPTLQEFESQYKMKQQFHKQLRTPASTSVAAHGNTQCPYAHEGMIQIDPWGNAWPCCYISGRRVDGNTNFPFDKFSTKVSEHSLSDILYKFSKFLEPAWANASVDICNRCAGISQPAPSYS